MPALDNTVEHRRAEANWNEASVWWAEHAREDKNRRFEVFPTVSNLMGNVSGKRVLDAGCGEGSFSRLLARAGAKVTGVDFARVVDFAIRHEHSSPLGVRYFRTDITFLPPLAARDAFDIIVCNLVLHCCPDLDPILRALNRQLRPGGLLAISDLHPKTFPVYSQSWTRCVQTSDDEFSYSLGPSCPELTLYVHHENELEQAFQRSGLSIEQKLAPPSISSKGAMAGLPRFVYYQLQKSLTYS